MSEPRRRALQIDDPIGAAPTPRDVIEAAGGGHGRYRLRELAVAEIHPNPDQPRRRFDEAALRSLAVSISERGVLQPVIVRPRDAGDYELVAGERRWRAAQLGGLLVLPALVDDEVGGAGSLEAAFDRERRPGGSHPDRSLRRNFADRDPLTRAVMDRMLAGVSTRRFAGVGEPVGEDVEQSSSATGKSTVSQLFIERTRTTLGGLMGRRLDDVRLAVMMLDGLEIADRTHVVALGISTEGVKIPLGLWEGSTENATLARTLLADLVDRGLDPEQAILFVIDGEKALRRAIKDVFGEHALVHRCHRHKERNVTDLLPERDRPVIQARIRGAWSLSSSELAEQRLEQLASELERTWPDAAASLREGLPETLTLTRLGITGQLAKTLCSTNPWPSALIPRRHAAPRPSERRARCA
jgi:transposase-like protein